MKKLNSFYVIGSVGVIVIASLHMLMAFILSDTSVHSSFFVLYPVFITFLVIGTGQMIKNKKMVKTGKSY